MTVHESIVADINRIVGDMGDCAIIAPDSVARACMARYGSDALDARIAYASLEHFKQMARKALRGRFDEKGDDNAAYRDQGELFSGHLQDRYPLPRKGDEEPNYKLRSELTDDEARWNIRSLRRSADARMAHADALEAWFENRSAQAA